MLDVNNNIQRDLRGDTQLLDEEFKVCQYSTVDDVIYGKTYHFIDLSVQSQSLIENFENKIKTIIYILEEQIKVKRLIS